MAIKYQDVISSNIRAVAWEKGIGYLWFGNGRRFAYTMAKELFDQMKAAASIGSFFSRMVKGKCPVVWNGWACDNSPCQENATLQAGEGKAVSFRVCATCSTAPRFEKITFTPIPES